MTTSGEFRDAARFAVYAMQQEFLYQTGQFCRPEQDYPPQGSVHRDLMEAITRLDMLVRGIDTANEK